MEIKVFNILFLLGACLLQSSLVVAVAVADGYANITFQYYLKSDPKAAVKLDDIKNLPDPPKSLLVYIHGWNKDEVSNAAGTIKFKDDLFVDVQDYDALLLVDWTATKTKFWKHRYIQHNWTPETAFQLATELQSVKHRLRILPSNVTVAAQGIGAAIMGQLGRLLQRSGSGTVKKMVALDPVVKIGRHELGDKVSTNLDLPEKQRLNPEDAAEVVVIHTSTNPGTTENIGGNDLYFYNWNHPIMKKCPSFRGDCAHNAAINLGIEYLAGRLENVSSSSPSDLLSDQPSDDLKNALDEYQNSTETEAPLTIFVLDYSGSMQDYGRMDNLVASTKQQLSTFPLNRKVAMVAFGERASLIFNTTIVSDNQIRTSLVNKVRKNNMGWTSIGAGLLAAIHLIPKGTCASIILTSDGEENKPPLVADVEPQIPKCTTVNSIAYGPKASLLLEGLSRRTGGKLIPVADFTGVGKLWDGLQDLEDANEIPWLRTVDYPTKILNLNSYGLDYIIDQGVKDLTFTLDTIDTSKVSIVSPDGNILDTCTEVFVGTSCISQTPTPGTWNISPSKIIGITRRRKGDLEQKLITVRASSTPDIQSTFPVLLESSLSNSTVDFQNGQLSVVYATLSKAFKSILGANVAATITSPENDTVEIVLYDSGIGADEWKDDGIYSRYISIPLEVGDRYEVKVTATCIGNSECKIGESGNTKSDLKIAEQFERETIAGSIRALSEYKLPPPSPVSDLRVLNYDRTERTVILIWTAMSASADSEITASGVELQWAGNDTESEFGYPWENINETSILSEGFNAANPREVQTVTVSLDELPECVLFNIRYSNEDGEFGEDSNIVSNCDWEETNLGLVAWILIIVGAVFLTSCVVFVCVKKKVYHIVPTS